MKIWKKYIKPYKKYFILGPICILVEVIGEVLMPKYLSMILNNASSNTPEYSVQIMILMILTAVMMLLGGVGGAYYGAKASVNFASDLRGDIYKKVQTFSFTNIDKFSTGSLVTRLTNDVTQIQSFINTLLRISLRAPGMMIGALIMAIILRPSLSLVFVVAIPAVIIFVIYIIYLGLPRFNKMQMNLDQLNTTVQENITNQRVVKSFVRKNHEIIKFSKVNDNLKNSSKKALKIMIILSPVMTLILNLTIVFVIWMGAKMSLLEFNAMPIGDLSAFIMYCNQILMSLMTITVVIVMSSRSIASQRRIKEILIEDVDIMDVYAKHKDYIVKNGDIEFRNVSFRYYKQNEEKVLDNINFKIKEKSIVGIIGPTGSGKTSLVSLITRLYDPDQGEILIDGIDVKDYTLVHLRDGVGMVLQNNTLFSGSIEDNIKWGNQEANDIEIIEAAKLAQADKFIVDFSKGYKTKIEQGGNNISGGQKQRLCIARTLLKHPKIIILDDSMSAVDTATEKMIRTAFKNKLKDVTKIIIAQRISSVIDSDQIIVLDEGKIVGQGNHEYLMNISKVYKEIYDSQIEIKEDYCG